jgi:hypothetical protein
VHNDHETANARPGDPGESELWAAARGVRRPVVSTWLPGKVFVGYRAGHNLVPGPPDARITFEDHVLAEASPTP